MVTAQSKTLPRKTAGKQEDSLVKSAVRVMEILELFSSMKIPLTGMDISRRLGYPKSSTNAILKSLVALGYLTLDADTLKYFPSFRMAYLSDWVPHAMIDKRKVDNLAEQLHDMTGETVTLSMRNGSSMQFVKVLPGKFPISLIIAKGFSAPIFGTSVGAAYLSTLSVPAINELYYRYRSAGEEHGTNEEYQAVCAEVASVRKLGYANFYNRVLPDTGAIAMPLHDEYIEHNLVIGVGGLATRIRRMETEIVKLTKSVVDSYRKWAMGQDVKPIDRTRPV